MYMCCMYICTHEDRMREEGGREGGKEKRKREERDELSADKNIFIQSIIPQSDLQTLFPMCAMI